MTRLAMPVTSRRLRADDYDDGHGNAAGQRGAGRKHSCCSPITLPTNSAALNGTVTDDGLPTATVTTAWTKISGPGTVIFGNASLVDTTASFSLAGTYVLRLTATDSAPLSNFAEVTVTVNPQVTPVNVAPTVSIAAVPAITLPTNTAALNGTVTDDGLPTATVTTAWSTVSGPGAVTFANAAAVDTTATFSAAGTYVLRLTANDSQPLSNFANVTVTVNPQVPPGGSTQTFPVSGVSAAIVIRDTPRLTSPAMTTALLYPAPVTVSGMTGATISKVVVRVNGLTHTFTKDIDMLLVGPGGQKVMLMSDTGGTTATAGAANRHSDLRRKRLLLYSASTKIATGYL